LDILLFIYPFEDRFNMIVTAENKQQPLRVIADSNALFIPLRFRVDVFAELERLLNRNFELVLLSPVKKELEVLAKLDSPKMRSQAIFALNIARRCKHVKVNTKTRELTDDAIFRIAKLWNVPVFTNDKLLWARLRDISVPVIYLRAKSRLEIDGMI
jgi:rRNA-processing protein FCF1